MIPLLPFVIATCAEEPMAMGLDDFIKKVRIEPHEIDALGVDHHDDVAVGEAVQELFDRKGGGILHLKPTKPAEEPVQAEHIMDGFKRDAALLIRPKAFEILGKGRLPKLLPNGSTAPLPSLVSTAPSAASPADPSSSPHAPMAASPTHPAEAAAMDEGMAWTDEAGEEIEPYDPELAEYLEKIGIGSPWPQGMVDEYWPTAAPTESPAEFIVEAVDGVLDHWNMKDWTVVDEGQSSPTFAGGQNAVKGDDQDTFEGRADKDAFEEGDDEGPYSWDSTATTATTEESSTTTLAHIDWMNQVRCTNVSEQPWLGGQIYDDAYAGIFANSGSHAGNDSVARPGGGHYADGFGLDGRLVDLNGFYQDARPSTYMFWELCIPFDEHGNTVPMDFWANMQLPNTQFEPNTTTAPSPTSPIDTNKTMTWQAGGVDDDPWPVRDAAGEGEGVRKEYSYRDRGSQFVGFEDLHDLHAEFEYDSYGPIQRPLKVREALKTKLNENETKHEWRLARAAALGRDGEAEAKLSQKEVWDRFHENKENALISNGQEWAHIAKAFIRVKQGRRTMTRAAAELFEPEEIKGIMNGATNFWDTIRKKSDPLYYAGPEADAMYQKAKIPKSIQREDQEEDAFRQNLRAKMNQLANYNLNPGLAGNETELSTAHAGR